MGSLHGAHERGWVCTVSEGSLARDKGSYMSAAILAADPHHVVFMPDLAQPFSLLALTCHCKAQLTPRSPFLSPRLPAQDPLGCSSDAS